MKLLFAALLFSLSAFSMPTLVNPSVAINSSSPSDDDYAYPALTNSFYLEFSHYSCAKRDFEANVLSEAKVGSSHLFKVEVVDLLSIDCMGPVKKSNYKVYVSELSVAEGLKVKIDIVNPVSVEF